MHADTTGPIEYAEKNSIGPPRYDYLDNIKWVLAVLVIFHHAAAIAGQDPFPLNLPRVIQSMQYQYDTLSRFQAANQGFFMGLYFFISAYFVVPSYNKKGKWFFLRDKLKRLGIPILLTVFIIDPVVLYISDENSFFQSMQNSFTLYGEMLKTYNIVLGVTWFCWTLIVFNMGYIIYRMVASPQAEATRSCGTMPSFLAIVTFAIIMIPFDYLALYLMNRLGTDFLGFHLLKFFPMYIAMYCFGIKAYTHQWLEQINHKSAFIWLVIWIFAMIFRVIPFETIGMSIFLLYSFRELFNANNKLTQILSRSAYAAYIIQGIPLCFLGKLLIPHMSQMPVVNFLVVGIPSVIISFGLGYFLCQLPVLRKIL